MSILHLNVLSLAQTKKQFSKILPNTKNYDLKNNRPSKWKQFSKKSKKTTNNIKIKGFLKYEDEKKYKHSGILTYIFFIYNCLIIFRKNCNKLIWKNVL